MTASSIKHSTFVTERELPGSPRHAFRGDDDAYQMRIMGTEAGFDRLIEVMAASLHG